MEDNLNNKYKQKIDEAWNKLPQESRNAINRVNWKLIILGLKKYTEDQLDNLEIETELLLCGITKPEDYPIELADRLHLSKEDTLSLIREMNQLVFQKIQKELQKIIEKKGGGKDANSNVSKPEKPIVFDPRFTSLEKGIQEAIALSGWREKLYEIAKKYKLQIDQMSSLEEITVKMISNIIPPNKYEEELKSKINLQAGELLSLIKDINENILGNIHEIFKKNLEKPEPEIEEVPIPPYKTKEIEGSVLNQIKVSKEIDDIKSNNYREPVPEIEKKEEIKHDFYKESGIEILKEKLDQVKIIPQNQSDYSIIKSLNDQKGEEKIINPTPETVTHDQYREEI